MKGDRWAEHLAELLRLEQEIGTLLSRNATIEQRIGSDLRPALEERRRDNETSREKRAVDLVRSRLEEECRRAQDEVVALRSSMSWRLTAPLRWFYDVAVAPWRRKPQPSGSSVAVILTCYNLGSTLEEALRSARCQTVRPWEIVIIDDGSDDPATREVLRRLEDWGERVVRTENRGVSAARNLGARVTSAPLLVFLDADDRLDSRYLEKTREPLVENPELLFVSTGMRSFGASQYEWCPPQPSLVESLARGVPHVSSLMRRQMFSEVGGWDESVEAYEEQDFWTRVMARGDHGVVLKEPLLEYRVRPDSLWHSSVKPGRHSSLMREFYERHREVVEQSSDEILPAKKAFIQEQVRHHAYLVDLQEELETELDELSASPEQKGVGIQLKDGEMRAAVLAYHRVAGVVPDPHGICVRPEDFQAHLELILDRYQPVSLTDIAGGSTIPDRAIAITIDDGYLDGLTHASEILISLGIPATFFVTGAGLRQAAEPWWDVVAGVFLSAKPLPAALCVELAGEALELGTASDNERKHAHDQIYDVLFSLGVPERDKALGILVRWSGLQLGHRDSHRLLLGDEVRRLSALPAMTIGAHSRSHLFLPQLSEAQRRDEIESNRRELEEILGESVDLFSYPYGGFDAATVEDVRRAGFAAAVTVEPGLLRRDTDPHLIPRLEVSPGGAGSLRELLDSTFDGSGAQS